MFDKLNGVETRFVELEKILSDPEIVKDQEAYQRYIREHAELIGIVTIFRKYKHIMENIEAILEDAGASMDDMLSELRMTSPSSW